MAGLVVDHTLSGGLRTFPEAHDDEYALVEMPAESIVETLCEQAMAAVGKEREIAAVGVGVPGLLRNGVVEESHRRFASWIRSYESGRWALGVGIGYWRYPLTEGVREGGHTVVTLDDKENYCGCGGRGHLEGIMGHRAMRLQFLDMEPEEVFEAAKDGDPTCLEFKKLWHKALTDSTATSIHLRGPGRFFQQGSMCDSSTCLY